MTILETIEQARALISDPAHWSRFGYARYRPYGRACSPLNPKATCWCVVGALRRVTGDDKRLITPAHKYLETCFACGPGVGLSDVNDWQGHTAILAVLDTAIARLGKPAA